MFTRSAIRLLLLALAAAAFGPVLAQTKVYLRYGGPFTRKAITGIRAGNPAVFLSAKHGFANGEVIAIQGVSGMPAANGIRIVQGATDDSFQVTDLGGQAIEIVGVWESKGWAGRVRETALAAHPRGLLDGPDGRLTTRVKDPDGTGAQRAPAARVGWVPWDSVLRRYDALSRNPQAALVKADVIGGHGIFGAALAWYADNINTRYRDAAKFWLNNIERAIAYNTVSSWFGSCREEALYCGTDGDRMLWSGIYYAEAAHAYSLLREQMTSAERSALISKLFQGIWGEACENRLKPGTGTMETTTGWPAYHSRQGPGRHRRPTRPRCTRWLGAVGFHVEAVRGKFPQPAEHDYQFGCQFRAWNLRDSPRLVRRQC